MNNIEQINHLVHLILEADESYYNYSEKKDPHGKKLTDQEYDALKDTLRSLEPNHPIFEKVGEKPSSMWKKAPHEILMGSLEKVHTEEEFIKWAENFKNETFVIQPKYDGLSLSLRYVQNSFDQAITRGDGSIGEDISENVRKMCNFKNNVDSTIDDVFSVRSEIILDRTSFEQINTVTADDPYKNPRNAAAGIARRLDGRFCKYLKLFCYDIDNFQPMDEDKKIELIRKLNLPACDYYVGNLSRMIEIYKEFKAGRDKIPYSIDGMVIKVNSWKKQQELGTVNNRPKGQIAWKFDPPGAVTTLLKVTPEVGRTGVITPLGHVDPVDIDGSTVSKVTLHNYAEIKRLGVGIGDLVMLVKSGDIIPQITSVIEHRNNPIEEPKNCPVCQSPATNDGVKIYCTNEICSAKILLRIVYFIKTVSIDGIGEALIEKLLDCGKIKGISDLYILKPEDIASIDGWGQKSAITIVSNITASKEMAPEVFLASMGIPTLSTSTAEDLWAKYKDLNKIRTATVEDICTMKGYSTISATKIVEGLKNFSQQIEDVLKHVVLKEKSAGKLSGKSFCFTGEMTRSRSIYQNFVTVYGGKNDSTVTKTTSYLVCNEDKGSSKTQKAKQYGVTIINEKQFMEMIGEKPKPKLITESFFD